MSHRCLSDEKLAPLLVSPADDSARVAAEACPRCGAHLAALGAFLAGDPDLPAADRDDADRVLQEHLARQLAGTAAGATAPRPAGRPWRAAAWTRRFALPAAGRWAIALGACAVVAVMVTVATRDGGPGPLGAHLRGGPGHDTPAITVEPARRATDGGVELRWQPVAGAEAYVVELFTTDLDTLRVLAPLAAPAVTLPADLLRDPRAAAGLLWRLRALKGGAEVAANRLQPLALP